MDAPFSLSVFLVVGLLVGVPPRSAAVQPAPTSSTRGDTSRVAWRTSLPPLLVTASRVPTSPARAPARITVLDSLALRTTGASSVATLLERRAGLYLRRYGEGGLATPALRGTGASQSTLLLDGQRITDPQIGHLDLSLLPTVLLRSVRVLHGPASPIHGSNGLGGAIQLRTVRPRSTLTARATAEAGAFGMRGGSLLLGGPVGDATSVLAAAEYQTTDGDFPYTDESRFPPRTVRRRNADRTRRTLYGSVRSRIGIHKLRVSGWMTHAERGLPPMSSTAPAQERQWDTQVRVWGQDRVPLGGGRLTIQGLVQRTRLRYVNPPQDIDQTGRTGLGSLETTLRHPVSPRWTLVGGLSGSHALAQHPNLDTDARQEHLSLFTEGRARYGRVSFYPALRTDIYWMPRGTVRRAVSPRLGLNWQPSTRWPGLHAKMQIGRAFRVPTFNDRYWQPGGNPDLRPERSWNADAGLRLDRPWGHLELTAFAQWRRDQIVWQPTGHGYWAPRNVGRVRTFGTEASAEGSWTFLHGITLRTGLTYTLTDARNRSDPGSASYNKPLRYVPRSLMKTHSTVAWGPVALTVHARYAGRRYVTSDGSEFLEPYVSVSTQLRLRHRISGVQTELSLLLDNALDTDYRSVGGRPMPPRHARIRLLLSP